MAWPCGSATGYLDASQPLAGTVSKIEGSLGALEKGPTIAFKEGLFLVMHVCGSTQHEINF